MPLPSFCGGMLHGVFESALRRHAPSLLQCLRGKLGRALYVIYPPPAGFDGNGIEFGLALYGDSVQHWERVITGLLQSQPLQLGHPKNLYNISHIDATHSKGIVTRLMTIDDPYIDADILSLDFPSDGTEETQTLSLTLLTPVTIMSSKLRGQFPRPYSMQSFVRSLYSRAISVMPHWLERCQIALPASGRVEELVRHVELQNAEIVQAEWLYTSTTKARAAPMRGLVGRLDYVGEIPAAIHKLIVVGQWLGVGQATTMGHGWYRCQPQLFYANFMQTLGDNNHDQRSSNFASPSSQLADSQHHHFDSLQNSSKGYEQWS